MRYVIAVCIGYLLGCSNMALYLARRKNVDLKSGGSGNLGASNATAMLGWVSGALVAIHDIGKSALAVYLAMKLFPQLEYVGAMAGIASVLGHVFPFYLKFRGGKGFASYLGMTLALNWKLALVIFAVGILITVISDYIVLATTATVLTVPAYLGWSGGSLQLGIILAIGSAVIIYKHRMNYVRICNGTEIGLRSVAQGKHRV